MTVSHIKRLDENNFIISLSSHSCLTSYILVEMCVSDTYSHDTSSQPCLETIYYKPNQTQPIKPVVKDTRQPVIILNLLVDGL